MRMDGNWFRTVGSMAHLIQELHVLPTEARLTKLEKLMRRCGVVQDDLEDLRAEEVGEFTGGCAHTGLVRGCRHGGASVGDVVRRLSFEGCSSPFDEGLIVFSPVCCGFASIGTPRRGIRINAIPTPGAAFMAGTGLLHRHRRVLGG